METATHFQNLILKAYGTSRIGVFEADMNLYSRYEEAVRKYNEATTSNSPDLPDLAFKAGKKIGKMVMGLQHAFEHVIHTTQLPLNQEHVAELKALSLLLMDPTEININYAINRGNKVFDEIGLKPIN